MRATTSLARAALAQERLAALERSLAEREGIPPAARALAEEGAGSRSRCSTSSPATSARSRRRSRGAPRRSWPTTRRPGWRCSQRARDAGLGSLAVLVGTRPAERVAELPVVPLDALLAATVASVTDEGFGFDPQRGELWFAGETAEAVLLELESAAPRARARGRRAAGAGAGGRARGRARRPTRAEEAEAAYAQVAHCVPRARPIRPCCGGSLPAPTGSTRR